MAETAKYCRREVGDETPPKFCMNPIKRSNALEWCDECRAARVPMWPALTPAEQEEIARDAHEKAIAPAVAATVALLNEPMPLKLDDLEGA